MVAFFLFLKTRPSYYRYENIMIKLLWTYVAKKIDTNQFGAVKRGSTVNAMVFLVDKLHSSARQLIENACC